jgi:hypothetical protein
MFIAAFTTALHSSLSWVGQPRPYYLIILFLQITPTAIRYNSVGTATGYRLDGAGSTPGNARSFS